MKKKILALALSAALLVGLLPVSALAAGTDITVKVGAYDYTASDLGVTGASKTGVILDDASVTVPAGTSAADAVKAAFAANNIPVTVGTSYGSAYVSEINGLGAGAGYSGWCLDYDRDSYSNYGLGSLTLKDGDVLEFHYSCNYDTATDDIGTGWYGSPVFSSLTVGDATVHMTRTTTYDASYNATTSYYENGAAVTGSGTQADPFQLTVPVAAGAELNNLSVSYTTTLNSHYAAVAGLAGADWSAPVTASITTRDGAGTWFTLTAQTPFADVTAGSWYAGAVLDAYSQGLFQGTDANTFSPALTMSRAMLVTVLYRMAGSPAVTGTCPFTDVPAGSYYENAVIWGANLGLVSGISADSFAPDSPVTREQAATFLHRYAVLMGYHQSAYTDLSSFTDAGAVSDYALASMQWAVGAGLMKGMGGAVLAPGASATRAQMAALLTRLCDTLQKGGWALTGVWENTAAQLSKELSAAPEYGSEWLLLSLCRGGASVSADTKAAYLKSVADTLKAKDGVLSDTRYTEYSRVILAVKAAGGDPADVGGYDLTSYLADTGKVETQGVSGVSFALLALNCCGAGTDALRQTYVDWLLASQHADGGFAASASAASDPDYTAFALQALAQYKSQAKVSDAISKALACLSALQCADGGFASYGVENCESTAQVVIALCQLKEDPAGSSFTKNGCSAMDALLDCFRMDAGFAHLSGGQSDQIGRAHVSSHV